MCPLCNCRKKAIRYLTNLENTTYLPHIHLAFYPLWSLRFSVTVAIVLWFVYRATELAVLGAECHPSAALLYHLTVYVLRCQFRSSILNSAGRGDISGQFCTFPSYLATSKGSSEEVLFGGVSLNYAAAHLYCRANTDQLSRKHSWDTHNHEGS